MRFDTTGIFWDDYVAPRVPVIKKKVEPPKPVWLEPDYLPNLAEALAYKFDLLTDDELVQEAIAKHKFVWDIEVAPNYVLIGAMSIVTKKIVMWEFRRGEKCPDLRKLEWFLKNVTLIDFNGKEFDTPVAAAILAGFSTDKVFTVVQDLIIGIEGFPLRSWEAYRKYKMKRLFIDNIDLIELTPLGPSLKTCAGRIHAPRMMDLPFAPGRDLSEDQIAITRWYWTNDLNNTKALFERYKNPIELRELLTKEYGVDVRSKSDPQVAEAIIRKEVERLDGRTRIDKATIEPGRKFRYLPPSYLKYQSETMKWVLDFVRRQDFTIDPWGGVSQSDALAALKFPIGDSVYKMGVGGLHSSEKRTIHVANDDWELTDNDVTSYYPALMLQQGMYPPNVGPVFLTVFRRIFDRRIAAKREGQRLMTEGNVAAAKVFVETAETLKIVLNGTFGKTGERGGHAVVYYPEMMVQVTLSGQLALLLLIERLELEGINVVSANTDGIMIKCPRALVERKNAIIAQWQTDTELGMESVAYKGLYSRDVNNYVALYEKPSKKETDGFRYAKAIGTYRKILGADPMKWNPTCDICSEAVIVLLATGKAIAETIRECDDMRKFVEVRKATGGACKDGVFLGKAFRWYYAKGEEGEIVNAKTGHTISRSQGAKPCLVLPETIPDDLDYDAYVARAEAMLADFEPKVKKVRQIAA